MFVNGEHDEIGSIKGIKDIYKNRIENSTLEILENETRFDAYHFIENHSDKVNQFFKETFEQDNMTKTENDQTAILLIEFQKTWTEKGIFKKLINNEYTSRNVLSNTKELILEARKHGVKIIQAPLILDKNDKNYKKTPFPARLLNRFTKDTWKAEFTNGIYENNDIVIKGRYGFDACEGSDLEDLLKQHGITTVYLAGFTTDHCIKETMNSLIDKDFKCIMIKDCTASKNNKLQKKIESEFTTITSKELILRLVK